MCILWLTKSYHQTIGLCSLIQESSQLGLLHLKRNQVRSQFTWHKTHRQRADAHTNGHSLGHRWMRASLKIYYTYKSVRNAKPPTKIHNYCCFYSGPFKHAYKWRRLHLVEQFVHCKPIFLFTEYNCWCENIQKVTTSGKVKVSKCLMFLHKHFDLNTY